MTLAQLLATMDECDRNRTMITDSMWDALRSLARAELAEARKLAPRWVVTTYAGGAQTWRLMLGTLSVGGGSLMVAPSGWIIDSDTCDDHPTLHAAARAVCERIGIPYTSEGLPNE